MIVTSTSAFGQRVLDITRCKPGAVICDVARPMDINPAEAALHPDVLVIESGEVLIPLLVATSGAAPDNPDALELRSLEEKRRRLGESIGKGVQELHAKGALGKDLDRGLVDFYSLMGDRLVYLCWQVGEPEVSHWHSLEDGFAGRQQIKEAGLE